MCVCELFKFFFVLYNSSYKEVVAAIVVASIVHLSNIVVAEIEALFEMHGLC